MTALAIPALPTQRGACAVEITEIMDAAGVIINLQFRTPGGLIANAFGTPVRYQSLSDWQAYVATLWDAHAIREAWRQLWARDLFHDFDAEDFEKARRMLIARDPGREMVLREK